MSARLYAFVAPAPMPARPREPAAVSHASASPDPRRLIVGITGATGIVYGIRLLDALRDTDIETHLVMTRAAARTLAYEADIPVETVRARADVAYPVGDIGAAIASGSYRTMGMIIAPCSVRSMSAIATGTTDNLLTRAADVVLKERRRLVLLVRETPLHAGHLRTMLRLAEIGAIVMPPVPAFYTRPRTIDDIVDQTVGRALDAFDIDVGLVRRWAGTGSPPPAED
jgi:4-hydroxy-3-polyprenylbenzoate decarboxylase